MALEKRILELKRDILRLEDRRSERARAILSTHKHPVLPRHVSEPNMVLLPQASSSMPRTTQLLSAPSTPVERTNEVSSLMQSTRTQEAIKRRSERARTILLSHQCPVLSRDVSEQNMVSPLPQASSSMVRTFKLPSPPSTPEDELRQASSLTRSARTREAIERRSERARAILLCHQRPVLSRHVSEPNTVLLSQASESSSPRRPTEWSRQNRAADNMNSVSSDSSVDGKTFDCPHQDDEHNFVQSIIGDKMKQRLATKFKLLENALQQDRSTTDERTGSGDSHNLHGDNDSRDMADWRAICRQGKSPALQRSHNTKRIVMIEKARLSVTVVLSFEEKMKTDAIRATSALSLPPPLTNTALNEAYSQLSPVAETSIKTVIKWWRTNKLSADNVLATVKSFAGSSAALQTIFLPHVPEGDVSSEGRDGIPRNHVALLACVQGEHLNI